MKIGDLVKVQTKHEGGKLAVIIEPNFSIMGREWIVKRVDSHHLTICSPCDLEVISEQR